MQLIDTYESIFKNKKKVMLVMAHPDDAEIYAGGTIARLRRDGKEVRVVKMTLGNKGSRQEEITKDDLAKLREKEDCEAMIVLGVSKENNIYLNFEDGEVDNSLEEIGSIAEQIRMFKPDLIITHNPEDVIIRFDKDINWINHRDHRNTGMSAIDAAYPYSRDILFFPEHFENRICASHTTTEFLLVDYYDHVDTVAVEVTDYVNDRTKAIACHKSQYSQQKAQGSTDFFTKLDESGKRYERYRYVVAD